MRRGSVLIVVVYLLTQACSGEVDEYSMPSDLLPSLSIFYRVGMIEKLYHAV